GGRRSRANSIGYGGWGLRIYSGRRRAATLSPCLAVRGEGVSLQPADDSGGIQWVLFPSYGCKVGTSAQPLCPNGFRCSARFPPEGGRNASTPRAPTVVPLFRPSGLREATPALP